MNRLSRILAVFLLLHTAASLRGEEPAESGLDIKIRLNKTVHYQNEPIWVYFTITNVSGEALTLKLSDYDFFNYQVEVFTPQKVSLKEKDETFSKKFNIREQLKRKKQVQGQFRDMKLEPSQILGMKINLQETYDLGPGFYNIRGRFFPMSSFFNAERVEVTPYIRLIVKEDRRTEQERIREKRQLRRELKGIITPDDSIEAFFEGKMHKNWEKFFYVIDLRRLIQQFPVFNKSFKEAADQEKNRVVEDFRAFLKQLNSDERIIEYEIAETVIRKKQAISTVIVTSRYQTRMIKREYRFGLILKDHWYIYGYTVIQK